VKPAQARPPRQDGGGDRGERGQRSDQREGESRPNRRFGDGNCNSSQRDGDSRPNRRFGEEKPGDNLAVRSVGSGLRDTSRNRTQGEDGPPALKPDEELVKMQKIFENQQFPNTHIEPTVLVDTSVTPSHKGGMVVHKRRSPQTSAFGERVVNDLSTLAINDDCDYHVIVANFPWGTSEGELWHIFERNSPSGIMITNNDRQSGEFTSAEVYFKNEKDMYRSVISINNMVYRGRNLVVLLPEEIEAGIDEQNYEHQMYETPVRVRTGLLQTPPQALYHHRGGRGGQYYNTRGNVQQRITRGSASNRGRGMLYY